jgi:hypothetical protein
MKKWLSLLLVCVLLLPCAAALGEDSSAASFDCTITAGVVSKDAKEILDSPSNRAMLTVCLLLDLGFTKEKDFVVEHIQDFMTNDSYVSSDGKYFAVLMYSGGTILSLFYTPVTQEAKYYIKESGLPASSALEVVEKTAKGNDYAYKNDAAEITKILKYISEGLSSD